MAKKATNSETKGPVSGGKSLVIVESPKKAEMIQKFLGGKYHVQASIGHVRDLPQKKGDVPGKYRDEPWASLAVNVTDRFQPLYIVPDDKKPQVAKLKKLLKECDNLYLATDEDREGEAISWHLLELLAPKVPVHRLVFHEITHEAIQRSLANPRQIDDDLVRAQETRRILDRLYGWEVSPLLWRKIGKGLSAGRVQSVTVRLIVDRERARRAFVTASYWDLLGTFATMESKEFQADLVSVDGKRTPAGKDFDSATGKLKEDRLLLDEAEATALAQRLQQTPFRVASVEEKPYTQRPAAPFTTSTLDQEANRKLGFSLKRTMSVAQSLYENGYITYMRTDSTSLAEEAVRAARNLVESEYGAAFLPDAPRVYKSKQKNAQEAHEAIRPSSEKFQRPEVFRQQLKPDEFKLFELIWKRTVACQMKDARGQRISIGLEGGGALFRVAGKTIEFPGFLRAYVEGSDDPDAELADKEKILPAMQTGQQLECRELKPTGHSTQPPARFSEASLTKELEEMGIGRPSTYASIIETIQQRGYVFKKSNALIPTWTAFSVSRLLEEHLPRLVDYRFTAQMEDFLDAISRGEAEHVAYLKEFYCGGEEPGLKARLETKLQEIDARATSQFEIGQPAEGPPIYLRVGRYGPFLEQGEPGDPGHVRCGVPEDLPPDELTVAKAVEILSQGAKAVEPLGMDPETGRPVYVKSGRFGPYVQLGVIEPAEASEEPATTPPKKKKKSAAEKPKNASLLPGMSVDDVTLDVALKLLELPRQIGVHPELKHEIVAFNGRYGPYIKCGNDNRTLPAEMSPLTVSLEQCVHLLAQPKPQGRGRAAPKEPLKTFSESPVTGEVIRLLEGRYGPYVADGVTNASLPKGASVEEFTMEQALEVLAERAARAPAKKAKKSAKKAKSATKTVKKSAKKATAKKTTAKKTTTKKAAKKAAKKAVKQAPESDGADSNHSAADKDTVSKDTVSKDTVSNGNVGTDADSNA